MAPLVQARILPGKEGDQALINRILSNPLLFPPVFKQWLIAYLGPEVQVTQSQVINSAAGVYVGTGTPQGHVAAAVGSIFLRLNGSAGTTLYMKESGTGTSGWVQRDTFTNGITITDGKDIAIGGGTGSKIGQAASKLGFFGHAPVAQRGAYTQTYATAARTVNPASTAAFTGQDNAQAGTVYAKAADLEQLRQDVVQTMQLLNALIDDQQALGFAT